MKQNEDAEFAAWVWIDWADQKRMWALQIPGGLELEHGELERQVSRQRSKAFIEGLPIARSPLTGFGAGPGATGR
jgi:hypothetical protein